jgi:hypothetical protein
MTALLSGLGLQPLVTVSGRGYHLWLRFEAALPNERLFGFSIRVAAKTLGELHKSGFDYSRVKITAYPNPEIIHTGSLRLFGCRHVRSGVFSHVAQGSETLDETGSWACFEDYLKNQTASAQGFDDAFERISVFFRKEETTA